MPGSFVADAVFLKAIGFGGHVASTMRVVLISRKKQVYGFPGKTRRGVTGLICQEACVLAMSEPRWPGIKQNLRGVTCDAPGERAEP